MFQIENLELSLEWTNVLVLKRCVQIEKTAELASNYEALY